MSSTTTFADPRLATLDGFRVFKGGEVSGDFVQRTLRVALSGDGMADRALLSRVYLFAGLCRVPGHGRHSQTQTERHHTQHESEHEAFPSQRADHDAGADLSAGVSDCTPATIGTGDAPAPIGVTGPLPGALVAEGRMAGLTHDDDPVGRVERMPADVPHALDAPEACRMLLIMLPDLKA